MNPQLRRLTPLTGHGQVSVPTNVPRSTVFSPMVARTPSRVQQAQAQLRRPTGHVSRDQAARAATRPQSQHEEFGARGEAPPRQAPPMSRADKLKADITALRAEMDSKFQSMLQEMERMREEIAILRGEPQPSDEAVAEARGEEISAQPEVQAPQPTSTDNVRQKIEAAVSVVAVDPSDVRS